jgi:hypothetical protein
MGKSNWLLKVNESEKMRDFYLQVAKRLLSLLAAARICNKKGACPEKRNSNFWKILSS